MTERYEIHNGNCTLPEMMRPFATWKSNGGLLKLMKSVSWKGSLIINMGTKRVEVTCVGASNLNITPNTLVTVNKPLHTVHRYNRATDCIEFPYRMFADFDVFIDDVVKLVGHDTVWVSIGSVDGGVALVITGPSPLCDVPERALYSAVYRISERNQ